MASEQHPAERFGTVLGVAPGEVHVFSSHYESAEASEFPDRQAYRSFVDGHYMGQKWQCVEFARRWLYVNHGRIFDEVAMAYDIFRLDSIRKVDEDVRLPLRSFRNGTRRPPEPGALLIWDEGGEFPMTGHVAVIVEVTAVSVRIAEQNYRHYKWEPGRHYSRELRVTVTEHGEYHVQCDSGNSTILGWVMQTDDDQHA
ncbi:MAG: CHAP domain-containing protein, partial [Gammaproteobacteria bacterium]|nr:CHAP domain-containing protein [Gammaproteobacteria bacterium]